LPKKEVAEGTGMQVQCHNNLATSLMCFIAGDEIKIMYIFFTKKNLAKTIPDLNPITITIVIDWNDYLLLT